MACLVSAARSGRPASIPTDGIDALFQFGRHSRQDLRAFIETFPTERWEVAQEFTIGTSSIRATPRKVVVHILMHEIRHWAEIATLLRLHGLTGEFHDLLFSPVLSGERGEKATRHNP